MERSEELAIEGRIAACCLVSPKRNHRSVEGGEYVWMRCWPGDGIERARAKYTGRAAVWCGIYEGWLAMIADGLSWNDVFIDHHITDQNAEAAFLLQHGIAPGQPFLVRFHTLETSGSGECWEAWCAWDIVARSPWPVEKVIAAWQKWIGSGEETP